MLRPLRQGLALTERARIRGIAPETPKARPVIPKNTRRHSCQVHVAMPEAPGFCHSCSGQPQPHLCLPARSSLLGRLPFSSANLVRSGLPGLRDYIPLPMLLWFPSPHRFNFGPIGAGYHGPWRHIPAPSYGRLHGGGPLAGKGSRSSGRSAGSHDPAVNRNRPCSGVLAAVRIIGRPASSVGLVSMELPL